MLHGSSSSLGALLPNSSHCQQGVSTHDAALRRLLTAGRGLLMPAGMLPATSWSGT
jgi:hypothetical protein